MDLQIEKTADGLSAARIGQMVHAYVALAAGGLVVSTYSDKPVASLARSDFYSYGDRLAGPEDFPAFIDEMSRHEEQKTQFRREEGPGGTGTPWGKSQGAALYADGLVCHSTASHGGFKVFAALNRQIPDPYRNKDGWYEEDCEAAKVIVSLPAYFTDYERKKAEESVKNWFPDEWEAVNGRVLAEGESSRKDERSFQARHANDLIVIAASAYEAEDGARMVRCTATEGGRRAGYSEGREIVVDEAVFAVPADEYAKRPRFGFVIDADRHERLDAPVSPAP